MLSETIYTTSNSPANLSGVQDRSMCNLKQINANFIYLTTILHFMSYFISTCWGAKIIFWDSESRIRT